MQVVRLVTTPGRPQILAPVESCLGYTACIAVQEAPGGVWIRIALVRFRTVGKKMLSLTGVDQVSVGEKLSERLARVSRVGFAKQGRCVARVRSILANKGLTLSKASRMSERLYGRSSPYFLPHNLYFDLKIATFGPSIYRFWHSAASQVTGLRTGCASSALTSKTLLQCDHTPIRGR